MPQNRFRFSYDARECITNLLRITYGFFRILKKTLCNKVFVIQNSMEIWYINLRKSLEIQTSLIFSNVLQTVSGEHGIL